MSSENDQNLTLDASPKEPRDKISEIKMARNIEAKISQVPTNESSTSASFSTNTKKTSKSKTKRINNQAYANVINISHSNGIHIGSNITINHHNSGNKKSKENVPKTPAIDMLMNSTDSATTEDILFVSTCIGEGWRNLARALNYIEAQVDQFFESHINKGVKEVLYQILLDWIQNEADQATVGKLSNALWNSDHKEIVHSLSIRST